jgi:hypothetical protein
MKTKPIRVTIQSTVPTDLKSKKFTQRVFVSGVGAIGEVGTSHASAPLPNFIFYMTIEENKEIYRILITKLRSTF